jgi:hypothetical protein
LSPGTKHSRRNSARQRRRAHQQNPILAANTDRCPAERCMIHHLLGSSTHLVSSGLLTKRDKTGDQGGQTCVHGSGEDARAVIHSFLRVLSLKHLAIGGESVDRLVILQGSSIAQRVHTPGELKAGRAIRSVPPTRSQTWLITAVSQVVRFVHRVAAAPLRCASQGRYPLCSRTGLSCE